MNPLRFRSDPNQHGSQVNFGLESVRRNQLQEVGMDVDGIEKLDTEEEGDNARLNKSATS